MTETEIRAYNLHTMEHIQRVRDLLGDAAVVLIERAKKHDLSKLESPEAETFAAAKPLAGLTYGSPEWESQKKDVQKALDHHYANNRHHPEHYVNGVDDMTLFDVLEMLLDWKASSERHNDGNILKSIDVNSSRFKLSPQLTKILTNTVHLLDLT